MGYVACHITVGTARVLDTDEVCDLAWASPEDDGPRVGRGGHG